jgi:hypothetical protein
MMKEISRPHSSTIYAMYLSPLAKQLSLYLHIFYLILNLINV